MRIVFLYTELAEYTIACFRALKKQGADLLIIHYPINPEAPFSFDLDGIGHFQEVNSFGSLEDIKSAIAAFHPDKIVCSGWINKSYLRICREWRKKAECILTMDNHWTGTWKQQLMRLISRGWLLPVFKKIWVPGFPQQQYALKLGFTEKQILTGFYSCDVDQFEKFGNTSLAEKASHFPNVLLCVARYIPAKGYGELWDAFIQWQEESSSEWELWCAGTGEGFAERIIHPKIRHLGFVQKNEWPPIIAGAGVFVLPSHFEPWGVVVHEFAAAGFPLILSNRVGAAERFLTNENGWLVASGNKNELIQVFKNLEKKSTPELLAMANKSQELARLLTPDTWARTLLEGCLRGAVNKT